MPRKQGRVGLTLGLAFPPFPSLGIPPITMPLLPLGVDALAATADVSGDFGAFVAAGSTTCAGASISVPLFSHLALTVPVDVDLHAMKRRFAGDLVAPKGTCEGSPGPAASDAGIDGRPLAMVRHAPD